MPFALAGQPLHSRTLEAEAHLGEGGCWELRAEIVDLRKSGFVAIAGDLQAAGLLHQMQIAARFDPAPRRFEVISAAMPRVAFEASALSQGESCRDPVRNLEALVGTPLDADFGRRLGAAIGGPRGCSHVLAAARWLAASLEAALAWNASAGAPAFRRGERIFRRVLSADGSELAADRLGLTLQGTDIQCAPAAELARPIERLAKLVELRVASEIALPACRLESLSVSERVRSAEAIERSEWSELRELAALVGASVMSGFAGSVLSALATRAAGDLAVDALLQLGPTALQCISSRTEESPLDTLLSPSRMVCAGAADSCYIWRREGALNQARKREGLASGPKIRPERS
jgi:hypothetical protein